jgi:hypothetical protein
MGMKIYDKRYSNRKQAKEMKKLFKENKIVIKNMMLKVMILVVLSVIPGCGGHYGRLAVNPNVKKQFENYEVLPDHRYYYDGSFATPRVVIGIQERYTLQSDLWLPVALTPKLLKYWVDYYGFDTKFFRGNGSDILAENGKKIGVWYAFIDWRTWASVKMIDERVVQISVPIGREGEPEREYKRRPLEE